MSMTRTFSTTAILGIVAAFLVAGCGKQTPPPVKSGTKTGGVADSSDATSKSGKEPSFAMKEGKRMFDHYCAVCHGDAGDGSGQYYGFSLNPQPANFTDKAFMKGLTDETIFKVISEGSVSVGKSNMCPPWGKTFEEEEIEFLATYVQSFSGK